MRHIAEEKSKLLVELKDQAEAAVQRKERERYAERLADKLLLEDIMRQEEEAKFAEQLERFVDRTNRKSKLLFLLSIFNEIFFFQRKYY